MRECRAFGAKHHNRTARPHAGCPPDLVGVGREIPSLLRDISCRRIHLNMLHNHLRDAPPHYFLRNGNRRRDLRRLRPLGHPRSRYSRRTLSSHRGKRSSTLHDRRGMRRQRLGLHHRRGMRRPRPINRAENTLRLHHRRRMGRDRTTERTAHGRDLNKQRRLEANLLQEWACLGGEESTITATANTCAR